MLCSLSPTRLSPGTNSQGILIGFNKTVLRTLPRSGNLIVVESVLMAVAFLAMLLVRPGMGWGGVNEVWGSRQVERGAIWAHCWQPGQGYGLESWSELGARAESLGRGPEPRSQARASGLNLELESQRPRGREPSLGQGVAGGRV